MSSTAEDMIPRIQRCDSTVSAIREMTAARSIVFRNRHCGNSEALCAIGEIRLCSDNPHAWSRATESEEWLGADKDPSPQTAIYEKTTIALLIWCFIVRVGR